MRQRIKSRDELKVYQRAFGAALAIFEASKGFPREAVYLLTDQIRRSSRSVCANLAEVWRKRRYEKVFASKLSDAASEAGETQTWLEVAVACEYLEPEQACPLFQSYNDILTMLVSMIHQSEKWLIRD